MSFPQRMAFLVAAFSGLVLVPVARAQVGTGGSTGVGTFAGSDLFISVQKQKNVNQTDRERARFLNQANCLCQTPAYLKAVVLASSAPRAATVSPSATVSMYVGNSCNNTTTIGCCLKVKSVPFSEFRLNGIVADTSVDQLTRIWSTTAGFCGGGDVSGTGGITGTGGAGTGGSGSGGTGGQPGTGGADGISTGAPGTCGGTTFGQTLWVFIGTMGDGSMDVATGSLGFNVDPEAPIAPSNVTVDPADEALIVRWTALDTASVSDILGYQVLCTRADTTQVFANGAFTASFDSCPGALSVWPPAPPASFVCSDLLSTSATSARIKILENGITYGIAVAAIDKQGNASTVVPTYRVPVATKDFYYEYRHGDPQGAATGGFCAVSGVGSGGLAAAGVATLVALALTLNRRRRRSGRGQHRR